MSNFFVAVNRAAKWKKHGLREPCDPKDYGAFFILKCGYFWRKAVLIENIDFVNLYFDSRAFLAPIKKVRLADDGCEESSR